MPTRAVKNTIKGVLNDTGESYVSIDNIEMLNPFVLFDHLYASNKFHNENFMFTGYPRLAAITYPLIGNVEFNDVFGNEILLGEGGIGVSFTGDDREWQIDTVLPNKGVTEVLRLCLLSPGDEEDSGFIGIPCRADSVVIPEQTSIHGCTKILIGKYQSTISSIIPPIDMDYFHVRLFSGRAWKHQVSKGKTTGFILVRNGVIEINDKKVIPGEMALLEPNTELLVVHALNFDTEFLFIAGVPLVL